MTLAQVLGTQVVAGIKLEDLTLASSPLEGIPLAGIALGSLPLEGIPLEGISDSTGEENLADWCEYVNQQPGFNCDNFSELAGQTMLGLALQGVPLEGIPLEGIPLEGIPLEGIPLEGIPVGTPLEGIPLEGIDLTGTPLGVIPLEGIDMSGPNASPLAGIPLEGIPLSAKNAILNCPTGTFLCEDDDTLGEAHAAGAIKPTARLQDLGHYKHANGQHITLGELVRGLPDDTSLYDLLATILLKPAYDWEALPLETFPLQDFSTDGGTVTYTVSFLLNGGGPPVDGAIGVHMPPGARYVPESTALSGGPGTIAEPTLTSPENELIWQIEGVGLDTSYELTFQAKPGLSLGTEAATAKIDATGLGGTVNAPDPTATRITEPGEPGNGEPETAQAVQKDTLYLGYTSSGSDRDYFQVQAAPGEQLTIHLSHLNVDDDLVIYGPTIAPLRTPHSGAEAPAAGEVPFELEQRTQSITPEALTDVPQDALGQSALDVSDNRGLADEEVAVVSPEGGTYTIQVASFDGDFSNDPWLLRVEKAPAIPLPHHVYQPAGPRRRRDEADARGAGGREHAVSLRIEAVRRPLWPRGREPGLQSAADACSPNRRSGRCGDSGRCERCRLDGPQRPGPGLLLAREGQRRRPGSRQPARQPADRHAVRQVHRRRRRRCRRHPVRPYPRQLRLRERARLREHVLRRLEQPVPEHLRARLPADRRPTRRHQLFGRGRRTCPSSRSAGSSRRRTRSSARSPSTSTGTVPSTRRGL